MNIIKATKLLKEGKYITQEKWKDGDFEIPDYYLRYDAWCCMLYLVSPWTGELSYYEFDIEDILYDKWEVYED